MTFYKGNSKEAIRAMQLQKRRIQQQEDIEIKKKKIEEENKMTSIDDKFKAHYDAVEQMLRTDTIGLVTLEDMKKKARNNNTATRTAAGPRTEGQTRRRNRT